MSVTRFCLLSSSNKFGTSWSCTGATRAIVQSTFASNDVKSYRKLPKASPADVQQMYSTVSSVSKLSGALLDGNVYGYRYIKNRYNAAARSEVLFLSSTSAQQK